MSRPEESCPYLRWRDAVKRSRMGLRTLKRYASMGRFRVKHPTPRVALIEVASFDAFLEGGNERV